ncbi:MAG: radical SAM family heme chaperone HemW [Candidatus Neomarinimicrobiota bacterium]|jgi:oxygen-independent coproporphyrinogen-3 oxidase
MKALSLYIHIPFCARKCHYCDFYSLESLRDHTLYTLAACNSIKNALGERKNDYLVKTIYFGGGTPNFLPPKDLARLMTCINENYHIDEQAEISIEINPEFSNSIETLSSLKKIGFNRLSIGIQSLDDDALKMLGRIHNADTAIRCIKNAKKIFDNISVDIIYAIPGQDKSSVEKTLKQVYDLKPQHISAYNLTAEEGTLYATMLKNGELTAQSENAELEHFYTIHNLLREKGYHHYEISSYALNDRESKHNSSYWTDQDYLGIGPSAHSRIGQHRYAFDADLKAFIKDPSHFHSKDDITEADTLITRLRRSKGLYKHDISPGGWEKLSAYQQKHNDWLIHDHNTIKCTLKGWLLLDTILLDLM